MAIFVILLRYLMILLNSFPLTNLKLLNVSKRLRIMKKVSLKIKFQLPYYYDYYY